MRKKLLFLALALAATIPAMSRPSAASVNPCGPFGHRLVCGEDVYCCPASSWPDCACP